MPHLDLFGPKKPAKKKPARKSTKKKATARKKAPARKSGSHCRICGKKEDLRMDVCFDCATKAERAARRRKPAKKKATARKKKAAPAKKSSKVKVKGYSVKSHTRKKPTKKRRK